MDQEGTVSDVVPARAPVSRARRIVALGALLAAATSLALACLPDLGPLAPLESPDGGTDLGSLSLCGDGVIATLDDGGDAGETCDPGEAGAAGCTLCRLACDGFVDPRTDHCFFDAGATASYAAAIGACQEQGAHVATFASARETELLGDASTWIGLAQSPLAGGAYLPSRADEPGYPCPGCFALPADDAGVGFPPLPDAGTGQCVAQVAGRWYAVPCEDGGVPFTTICEREPVGRRGQGCGGAICFTLPATAGTKTYVLFASGETPAGAKTTCESYPDGRLVLLDTAEEREQLAREAVKFLPADGPRLESTFWIGLAFDAASGTWRWDDGKPEAERPEVWGREQPIDPGAGRAFLRMRDDVVDTQLALSDDKREGARRPFVCERAP